MQWLAIALAIVLMLQIYWLLRAYPPRARQELYAPPLHNGRPPHQNRAGSNEL